MHYIYLRNEVTSIWFSIKLKCLDLFTSCRQPFILENSIEKNIARLYYNKHYFSIYTCFKVDDLGFKIGNRKIFVCNFEDISKYICRENGDDDDVILLWFVCELIGEIVI